MISGTSFLLNLSSSMNASINYNLKQELPHEAYSSADAVHVTLLNHRGKGTIMAKIDIKDEYCIICVHPHDRQYLDK